MNAIALQRTVGDMIAEYDEKSAALASEIEAFNKAVSRLDMAACVGGEYGGRNFDHATPSPSERNLRRNLLVSAWKAIYSRLQIDRLATAKDKKLWERTIAEPPPLTAENAIATFGDYLLRARFHILRGLAEAFVDLDPAYKSHSKVKIGVKRLPKRVIVSNVGGWGSWGRDRLKDMLNALATYRGQNVVEYSEFQELDALRSWAGSRAGEVIIRGLTIRKFQNGNAHVIFDADNLADINRALAEFYGDVLPDAEEEGVKPRASTAVSKDLQFYPTPKVVVETILDRVGVCRRADWARDKEPLRVLEPSCGDGRMLDEIRARGHQGLGIEVHAGRAAEARAKGHAVVCANFLDHPPVAEFDVVVMNPPFYGRHWEKHVRHARKFLKSDGVLVSVLPATAQYDHDVTKLIGGTWSDLPVASFSESGTNIPTGYVVMRADLGTANKT